MEDLNNIHWHDSEIQSIVELPAKDMLVFNVQYPEDWDNDIFVPKAIVFEGYYYLEVNEMPFEGNPTILDADVLSEVSSPFETGGYFKVHIKTNVGDRFVTAKSVKLIHQHVGI